MKKLVILFFLFFVLFSVQSQILKSVDEFDFVIATKKDYESYKNLFEVNKLITGFGTFSVRHRAAREGRNPQTGAAMHIAASKVPGFKAGKGLKDKVKNS